MEQHTLNETELVRLSLLQRHPVTIFFALTLAVAWALWLPLVLLQD